MKYQYTQEVITYTKGMPLKLYVCRIDSVPFHWHKEMEMLFLVQGELQVSIKNHNYCLQTGDLVLMNANEVHSFTKTDKENLVIIIQLDLQRFKGYYPQIEKTHFFCNSVKEEPNQERYTILKKLLVDILRVYEQKDPGFIFELDISVQKIILHLIRAFKKEVISDENVQQSDENLKRLRRIIKYIDEHYMEKITLEKIAKSEHLSSYYFSHFFKDKMGITFQSYLKLVRLKKAYKMLLNTDYKVVDIAYKCGFANSQTFCSHFKEEFGVTPTQLRKQLNQGSVKLINNNTVEQNKYIAEDINKVLYLYSTKGKDILYGKKDREISYLINEQDLVVGSASYSKKYFPLVSKLKEKIK